MAPGIVVKNIVVVTFFAILSAIVLETVQSEGCEYFLNSTEGIVKSPNFYERYPNLEECIWRFETKQGSRIKLNFDYFLMEEQCWYNFVAIYDGATTNDTLLGKYCGNDKLDNLISTSNRMIIILYAEGIRDERGFLVSFSTVDNISGYVQYLTQYLWKTRQDYIAETNKWGADVTKSAIALFMQDQRFFATRNETGEEIAYELTLQLMSKLVIKKRISTNDLALFVNALTVACIKPTKFFGVNILAELRRRIDNSNCTNPFPFLSLCIGGEKMTTGDIDKLQQLFHAHLRPSWTEIQALVFMAMTCISSKSPSKLDSTLNDMALELGRKQQNNGTVENLKNTALVIQALLSIQSDPTIFDFRKAVDSIMEDTKRTHITTEEFYFIFPIFMGKTLLNINSNHCWKFIKTDLPEISSVRELTDDQIQVQISVIVGDDKDFTKIWKIKVPSDYSLYEVLENITSSESEYKIRYIILNEKPYVDGVAKFQDSAIDDSFWFIYKKLLSSTDDPVLVKESPVDIKVNENEELILWYRS